jgi:hypothetical protein
VRIEQLTPAETGWKAVFSELDGGESLSRIVGWGLVRPSKGEGGDDEVVGFVIDPNDPSRIVRADEAESPDGGTFFRYRFVAPEPIVIQPPAPPPPVQEPARLEDAPEQLAKGLLKRKR